MATWPASLPAPLVDGYGVEPVDQTIATDMESGTKRVRRRSAVQIDHVSVSYNLDDAQMATFRTWFYGDLAGGAAFFDVSLWVGKTGSTSAEARFIGQPTWSMVGNHRWIVTGKMEVRYA